MSSTGQGNCRLIEASGALVHADKVSGGTTNIPVCFTDCSTVAVSGPQTIDYIKAGSLSIRLENDEPTYLHNDLLGSPVAGTDKFGNVIWQEQYTPYGEKILNSAANDDLGSFTGHIDDSSTGLTYMQARYSYAANNPINLTDPDGRCAGVCTGLVIGGITLYRTYKVVRAVATVGTAATGVATVLSNESTGESSVGGKARFVGDKNGVVVDTDSTLQGSYDQPDGGRTDVLQGEDHGAGNSHTHRPETNTNPETGETFVNGLDGGGPVTEEDVDNIISGEAPPSTPKGR